MCKFYQIQKTTVGFFILCFFLSTTFIKAQSESPIRKGRFISDLDLTFSSHNATQTHGNNYTEDVEVSTVQAAVDIDFGYSIMDNLVVGINVFSALEGEETIFPDITGLPGTANTTDNNELSLTYGAFARYYFLKNKFRPFLGGSIGYGNTNITNTTSIDGSDIEEFEIRISGLAYNAKIGMVYFFNDHVGMELTYSYVGISHSGDAQWEDLATTVDYTLDSDLSSGSILVGAIFAL